MLDYVSSALQTIHRWIKFDELSHFAACILDKDNKVLMEVVIIIMEIQHPRLRSIWLLCFILEYERKYDCFLNLFLTAEIENQWWSPDISLTFIISGTCWQVKHLLWNDSFNKQFLHYNVDHISSIWKISSHTKVGIVMIADNEINSWINWRISVGQVFL